jgi:hypothetical protein
MAGQTVTRAELSKAVYQEIGLSRNESAELVEAVIAAIADALGRGDAIRKPERRCRSAPAVFSSSAPRTRSKAKSTIP